MFGGAFDFLKGMGGQGGGFSGLGDRLKNFGVTSDMRGQMGEDAFKKFRSDQLWNMGAALQGQEGGRDPGQYLPTAQTAMQGLQMQPYQMGQGGMMGMGLGQRRRRGGLLDMGNY